jgi:predicted acyl esterase
MGEYRRLPSSFLGAWRGTRSALAAVAAGLGLLAAAPVAEGAIPAVFGDDLSCTAQPANGDIRLCSGPTHSFDGTKIDTNVILPPEPVSGADGPYPAIGYYHGWGGRKIGIESARVVDWARRGYVVFSVSDRGWGSSCGGSDPDRLTPQCSEGYNHLMDTRFEVRDAQHLLSLLADEGVIQPRRIAATGGSYGGGLSMTLAALRNRVMEADGSLAPWRSPGGLEMEIAAAAPEIPWTDLAYSLMPNGHTLDYVADAPYDARGRVGVSKASFVAGLFATGLATSNYALPLSDPDADLITWYALVTGGEPYDQNPLAQDITEEVSSHHSSYYVDHSQPPAPLLISNGWTDDLFPADEAIRFYNRTRSEHPEADIQLFFMDYGHMRGQNKDADVAVLHARQEAWFDYYLKGIGAHPSSGRVEALTQTCPDTAASEGPFTASTWADLAPGEVRFNGEAVQTVAPVTSDPTRGVSYDPVAGGGACATATGADQSGAASYRLEVPTGHPFTLIGSPTIIAEINSTGPTSQLAARLLDVAPSGDATLVARGLYRPEINAGSEPSRQVFQLHPNGYRFAAGHTVKLELLPNDLPYGRLSNGQLPVTVSGLELRLPVLESPDGGLIQPPAPKVLPPGYAVAADYIGTAPGGAGGQSAGGGEVAGGAAAGKIQKCKKGKKGQGRKHLKRCKKRKRR